MVVEGRSVEQRIYHVDMSEVEVYKFFGEVWRRETISDGTKIGRIRQMYSFPFQLPLED